MAAAADTDVWTCAMCTFVNAGEFCGMCEYSRPSETDAETVRPSPDFVVSGDTLPNPIETPMETPGKRERRVRYR